jgi:hypothetical protein
VLLHDKAERQGAAAEQEQDPERLEYQGDDPRFHLAARTHNAARPIRRAALRLVWVLRNAATRLGLFHDALPPWVSIALIAQLLAVRAETVDMALGALFLRNAACEQQDQK